MAEESLRFVEFRRNIGGRLLLADVEDMLVGVFGVILLVGIDDDRENCGNIDDDDLTGAEPGVVGDESEVEVPSR